MPLQLTHFDAGNWPSTVKVVHDAPVPKPGQGEVLVRITMSPVNPAGAQNGGAWDPGACVDAALLKARADVASHCHLLHLDIFTVMGIYVGYQPATFPAVPGCEGGARRCFPELFCAHALESVSHCHSFPSVTTCNGWQV